MYKKIFLIVILNITIIFLIIAQKYIDSKNSYLNKEIKKYNFLINELSKINKINKKIENIKIYTYKEAENKELNTIDKLIKSNFQIQTYEIKSNTIYSSLILDSSLNKKIKNNLINLFFLKYPFVIFKNLQLSDDKLNLQIKLAAPFKENNVKK